MGLMTVGSFELLTNRALACVLSTTSPNASQQGPGQDALQFRVQKMTTIQVEQPPPYLTVRYPSTGGSQCCGAAGALDARSGLFATCRVEQHQHGIPSSAVLQRALVSDICLLSLQPIVETFPASLRTRQHRDVKD